MTVMVFKPGTQAIVRGVSVDFERIRPQSLDAYLANGWFKTTEECRNETLRQEKTDEEEAQQGDAEPSAAPEVDEIDIYSLGILELRKHARNIGLKPGNAKKAELQKMVANYGNR